MEYDHNFYIKNNEFSCNVIAKLTCQILNRLQYLHLANIIHRDLKPSNIIDNDKHDLKV